MRCASALSLKPAVIVPIIRPDAHDAGNVAAAASFDAGTTVAVMAVEIAEPVCSLADVDLPISMAPQLPRHRAKQRMSSVKIR
jgi:hypothetical protein